MNVQTLETCTSKPPWTETNTCEFVQISSPENSKMHANSETKYTMGTYTWKSDIDAMDFHKQES